MRKEGASAFSPQALPSNRAVQKGLIMVNFAGEDDDAADARHDTPPRVNPFLSNDHQGSVPTFEEVRNSRVHLGGHVAPEQPVQLLRTGLVWCMAPGMELVDIGRTFTNADALENMHAVDLRTILAHLDSAAQAIKAELDNRYGMGRSIR